jgi:hypothetical protein
MCPHLSAVWTFLSAVDLQYLPALDLFAYCVHICLLCPYLSAVVLSISCVQVNQGANEEVQLGADRRHLPHSGPRGDQPRNCLSLAEVHGWQGNMEHMVTLEGRGKTDLERGKQINSHKSKVKKPGAMPRHNNLCKGNPSQIFVQRKRRIMSFLSIQD